MGAPTPHTSSSAVTIRDWAWILANAAIVAVAWGYTATAAGSAGAVSIGTLILPAVLSVAIVALAWIPHVRIAAGEVRIRTLGRVRDVALSDLVGIDFVTNPIFRQRIPRLVSIDGSSVMLPARGISWSGMTAANRTAVEEIQAQASAIGNELAIDV